MDCQMHAWFPGCVIRRMCTSLDSLTSGPWTCCFRQPNKQLLVLSTVSSELLIIAPQSSTTCASTQLVAIWLDLFWCWSSNGLATRLSVTCDSWNHQVSQAPKEEQKVWGIKGSREWPRYPVMGSTIQISNEGSTEWPRKQAQSLTHVWARCEKDGS